VTVYSLFGQAAPAVSGTPSGNITLGLQFSLSTAASLTGIWFYSASGAGLPGACCVYTTGGGAQVAGTVNSSPSWSGVGGSGWVKCSYDGSVTLAASTNYTLAIFDSSSSVWAYQSNYWTTGGPGASGLVSGIITAPNTSTATHGQCPSGNGSSLTFPNSNENAPSGYWIDVELTITGGASGIGGLPAPVLIAAGVV
jgi:Domain of unknown function (DUF4082)